MNLFQQGWRYASEMLLEWFVIVEVNLVFDGTGAPKLIRFECKGIMIREQEFPHYSSITGRPLTQAIEIQFLNQFSCCSCTVIHSLDACTPSAGSQGASSGGTNVADTTCATHTPFLRNIALSVIFRTTIETCLLPAVSMVYACNTCSPWGSCHALSLSTSVCLMGTTITWVSYAGAHVTLPSKISA